MAGHQIALLRILRLKPALQATVTSPEFKALDIFQEVGRVLLKDEFWVYLFLMCRALYAPMRVLRLADQKVAAMDKLHFFVCQANSVMPRYLAEAEHHMNELVTDGIKAVLADKTDLASEVVDAEEEDDSDESEAEELEEEDDWFSDDDEDMVSSTTALKCINILMLSLDGIWLTGTVSFISNQQEPPTRWTGEDNLTAKVMRYWAPRATAMNHQYSLAAYLLSPHPQIMKHASSHKTEQHHDAVAALISKLLLPKDIVSSEERNRTRAEMVHTFWTEYSDYTLKMGKFDNPDMWMIAENPLQLAHEWHKTYSLPRTKVLGRLACLVTSKNLGIGSAERHWKIVKKAKGQSARLGSENTKRQALIYGAAMQQRARFRLKKLSDAGKLWCDKDFETLKLDNFCEEIIESARKLKPKEARIFRAWEEEWETKKVGPEGDDRFESKLVAKYGGLCWLDVDYNYRRVETHPTKMFFEKKRGDNKYIIFATYEGFDLNKDPSDQKDLYDGIVKTQADFYEEVVAYYKDRSDVKCYVKGGECDSDSEYDESS